MASSINADNGVVSGSSGLKSTADTSGVLALQSNGTTGLTLNTSLALGVGSGNSTGTSGQVLTSAGSGAAPTWATAASATVQTFTSSGTWTKPSGASFVMVEVLGAGGGGGSGRRGATNTLRAGGAGGGGGAFMTKTFLASEIGSSVTVTVGAGAAGGAARTTDTTNGASGSTGGQSAFGNYLRVWGGSGGTGGTTTTTTGGGGGSTLDATSPTTNIAGSSGATYIPGSFGRSFKVTGNSAWPGAGYAGGSGGFTQSGTYGGESSVYGGGGGGSGGWIDSSNLIQTSTKGGGNYQIGSVSGYEIINYAKGANGLPKWGGAGGSAYDGQLTYPFNFNVAGFGNSTFVVANNTDADGYAIQASTDSGVTWTQYRIGMPINCILWDGSKWVALCGNNTIYTTTDFVTWTTAGVCGDSVGNINIYCLAYYSGTYVAVGDYGVIQTSTDLVAWTTQTSGLISASTNIIQKVIHDGTRWIAVGQGTSSVGIFLTSTDAVTWTNLSANLPSPCLVYQITSSGSTYVIGANDGAPKLFYSTNGGTSWTDTGASGWSAVASGAVYAGGKFVFANQTQIYYSTTGTSFTLGYTVPSDSLGVDPNANCVASDGTTYIASHNYGSQYAAVTTTNLTSYTLRNAGYALPAVPATGGNGGIGGGGGGGGASLNGYNSGAGGTGGNGLVRVYTW